MMAVDSNKQTLLGTGTPTPGPAGRRKRPSSLMAAAQALPNVENSLEEFIARANQTAVDTEQWGAGTPSDAQQKAEDDKRKEQDALRWKNAEQQMRESEAREDSMRRQLDGLQGKLAEAEARAAVAGSSSGGMQAAEVLVAELRHKLDQAKTESMTAQQHAQTLEKELKSSRDSIPAMPAVIVRASSDSDGNSEERIRIAEAKAAKAIAAARAAAAGLTVSSADIAAIESGLVVTNLEPQKQTPWLWIAVAFIGGIAIMFGASKLLFGAGGEAKPVAAQAAPAPAPAPIPAAVAPSVTPIDPPKPAVAAAPAPAPVVTPIEPAPVAVAPAPVPAPVVVAPVAVAPVAPVPVHHAAPAAAPAHHAATAAKPAGGLADPFGDAPAPAPTPKKAKAAKPAGGISDPFAN